MEFDICLRPLGKHLLLCLFPRRKKMVLEWNTRQLKVARETLLGAVEEQEQMQPRSRRTFQVIGWMDEAKDLENQVDQLIRSLASDVRFWSIRSNHHLARRVNEMITRVDGLRRECALLGENQLVTTIILPPHDPTFVPSQLESMIGGDETLSEIRDCLNDSSVRTIGIVGMGGIGKTTIMKKLEFDLLRDNRSSSDHGFQYSVIWVTVSKDVDVHKIQKAIAYKAGFSISHEQEDFQRADIISRTLSRRNFIILLDDVWERLDFELIGIPLPNDRNAAKIIFTTRSEEVCNGMDADRRVRVPLLNPEQSMDLFKQKFSSGDHQVVVLDDPSINPLAKNVISKCGGLPLLLITVARAVSSYTTVEEWADAVRNLEKSPVKLRRMEDVITIIKFSFDHIKDNNIRECLLYCSLYREDSDLFIDRIVKYWLGEGFLNMPNITSFEDAHNRGMVVVNKLKCAFLLEPGYTDMFVKMHDVVRDMAISLKGGNVYIVYDRLSLRSLRHYETWATAEKIFLEECQIEHLPAAEGQVPKCPCLVTIIIRENPRLQRLSDGFFEFMPLLRVLDLSRTSLEEIPTSVGLLVELQYLGLHGVKIRFVPIELGNLVKLRQLHLGGTVKLEVIPQEVILRMSMLQLINLSSSKYHWGEENYNQENYPNIPLLRFKDLEKLNHLEDLGIVVKSNLSLETVLGSQFILSVITSLSLENIELTDQNLLPVSAEFPKLINLYIDSCTLSEELSFEGNRLLSLRYLNICNLLISKVMMVKNIVAETAGSSHPLKNILVLYITRCSKLTELRWAGQLPLLEQMHLKDCGSVRDIIREDDENNTEDPKNCYFPKLFNFTINNLQGLTCICSSKHPLLFPSLKFLEVGGCPELTRLSVGLNSCPNLQSLRGEQQWWDALVMDDQVKSTFRSRFQKIRSQ